jgi:hypothetical protein
MHLEHPPFGTLDSDVTAMKKPEWDIERDGGAESQPQPEVFTSDTFGIVTRSNPTPELPLS